MIRDQTNPRTTSPNDSLFTPRCLALDLEVARDQSRIYRFSALRGDTRETFTYKGGNLAEALDRLDALADGAAFLLGHNIVEFDLPHIEAANPHLRLLKLPVVDTLRINPLAFPRNPYHHLVKHYHTGALKHAQINDPLLDTELTFNLFADQSAALEETERTSPDLMLAWHWLTTFGTRSEGTNAFFSRVRRAVRPSDRKARASLTRLFEGQACRLQAAAVAADAADYGWSLAYALAWMSVAGGNSVMPPWVRHQFPEAMALVKRLRDTPCGEDACTWCNTHHDPTRELRRWFGFDAFRPEPADDTGRPLQQVIVEAAMQGRHALAVLPTGTGKSLCYQIPALSRYDKTGALTVVISPLVALMADQVAGLEAHGISCCAALNGLLSMPERANALDRVRMGDIGILIVAPEQLRSRAFRRAIDQREIGAWVLDEAHCLSKWGHDFRPDYRYVGRFIREKAGEGQVPPILCLTATAKPEVVEDVLSHFRDKIGIALECFDGGARRENLDFAVLPTAPGEKFAHIVQVLQTDLPRDRAGGAIVFCATRRRTEEIAEFLVQHGLSSAFFHAGLPPERKKEVQRAFIAGDVRVIVATNAFGMGIDKPDVRLVVHADIPGSLENYLQEAGRAGRDRDPARCVLLYTKEDVERQFGMSARSRLTNAEIVAILKALRRLDAKKRAGGEVIATPGEILVEDEEGMFVRDSATEDTRVRTAVSWLEESALLSREENEIQVFPSSLRVNTLAEAEAKLDRANLQAGYGARLLEIVKALMDAPTDKGISTDELMGVSGLTTDRLRKALYDLETLGLASNDTVITAFLHVGIEHSSKRRLEEAAALEAELISELREQAPDLAVGESAPLHLRVAAQHLKDAGHSSALPERLQRILRGIANDGRDEGGGSGSVSLRSINGETLQVRLQRDWKALDRTAELRRAGAVVLLGHWISCLAEGQRGVDLMAETTLGALLAALQGDLTLKAEVRDLTRLLDRALLWLHEMEVIRLNKGLAVFRPAMTIRLARERRGFSRGDFEPLRLHYNEQVVQIHIMAEYAERGLADVAEALRLTMDYFSLPSEAFLKRWLPHRDKELGRQTTPESWRAIVESLANSEQQRIVTDDRERTSVLVLAGPGSGKTRVLVHRIAYLVRVRREKASGILALAYNRHAALEIRQRLQALIGEDAKGVVVLTCHALAMRLAGLTFAGRAAALDDFAFKHVLNEAVALLKGDGLPLEEADEQRERLLRRFRWILVDEYQDIGPEQYELIAALAGRSLSDPGARLSLLAVGDDDQNIYSFAGASVEYVRRFEEDYDAKPVYLIENYRSSGHIVAAANAVIAPAANRMKTAHPIEVDRARKRAPTGGHWAALDPVSGGRVQVLPAGPNPLWQAVGVMTELQRLAACDPDWDWARAAVIAREWSYLEPVRTWCTMNGVPVQMASEPVTYFWRLRETRQLVDWLEMCGRLVDVQSTRSFLEARGASPWWALLKEAFDTYAEEFGGISMPTVHFIEWLAEWGRDVRQRQTGLLLLTAHRAKGLEFDHVVVLDGAWNKTGKGEDVDAARRLYYVAMTRAKVSLVLARMQKPHPLIETIVTEPSVLVRDSLVLPKPASELARRYERPTLRHIDIGYAGRQSGRARVHGEISGLSVGDTLTWRVTGEVEELYSASGVCVGRTARSFVPPEGMVCIEARVAAVVVWTRVQTDTKYIDAIKCDQWEVVMPELVFEPTDAM